MKAFGALSHDRLAGCVVAGCRGAGGGLNVRATAFCGVHMNIYGWIGLAFAGLLSLWQWDHGQLEDGQREQAARIDQAEIDRLTGIANLQAEALRDQRALQVVLEAIGTDTRNLSNTLNARTLQLRQDLAELKRTDEQVSAYLSAAVPAALGVRYARTATTNPVAWREGPPKAVRADPVPIAGSASAEP